MKTYKSYTTFLKKAFSTSMFLTLFALVGFSSSASSGALCDGGWVLVGGSNCDLFPIGGGGGTCLLFGADINANGSIEGNTTDICQVLDSGNKYHDISCATACGIDCSKQYCMKSASTDSSKFAAEARTQ
ncbi:hypothetical protein [Pseudomonas endophytica]|uniref:hypothetical protein n=1 Tax=Pseudomonas endophytica TaxID=1563157 RepID=UPI0012E2CF4D|nr:hypothetical protein [Pseudomonas endophytica]